MWAVAIKISVLQICYQQKCWGLRKIGNIAPYVSLDVNLERFSFSNKLEKSLTYILCLFLLIHSVKGIIRMKLNPTESKKRKEIEKLVIAPLKCG